MTDRPFDLDTTVVIPAWEVAFCRRHSEPFHAEWPKGIAVVQVYAPQRGADRFTARFPRNAEGLIDLDSRVVSAELVKVAPLCCFLGDTLFDFLTRDALSGKTTKRSGS